MPYSDLKFHAGFCSEWLPDICSSCDPMEEKFLSLPCHVSPDSLHAIFSYCWLSNVLSPFKFATCQHSMWRLHLPLLSALDLCLYSLSSNLIDLFVYLLYHKGIQNQFVSSSICWTNAYMIHSKSQNVQCHS